MKQAAQAHALVSTDGYPIMWAGITGKMMSSPESWAQKNDLWLHVQKLHGSHVIIPWMASSPWTTPSPKCPAGRLVLPGPPGQNVAVDVTPALRQKARRRQAGHGGHNHIAPSTPPDPSLAGS